MSAYISSGLKFSVTNILKMSPLMVIVFFQKISIIGLVSGLFSLIASNGHQCLCFLVFVVNVAALLVLPFLDLEYISDLNNALNVWRLFSPSRNSYSQFRKLLFTKNKEVILLREERKCKDL